MSRASEKRRRLTGRRESSTFVPMPHDVLNSAAWCSAKPATAKLVMDVFAQYNGRNNGDLHAAWLPMKRRGWRSKDTLQAAIREAVALGLIEQTRKGGNHVCSLYAVTWRPIDACQNAAGFAKHDATPTHVASGHWKQPPALATKKIAPRQPVRCAPPAGPFHPPEDQKCA